MGVFPAGPGRILAAVAGDPMARALEGGQLLDIQGHHVTGRLMGVTVRRLLGMQIPSPVAAIHQTGPAFGLVPANPFAHGFGPRRLRWPRSGGCALPKDPMNQYLSTSRRMRGAYFGGFRPAFSICCGLPTNSVTGMKSVDSAFKPHT